MTEQHPSIKVLTDLLLDQDAPAEVLMALRPLLSGSAWDAACEALDVCERHMTDAAICRDDQLACPAGWADAPAPVRTASPVEWVTSSLGRSGRRSYVIDPVARRLGVYMGHGTAVRFLYSVIAPTVEALHAEAERYETQEQEEGR